MADRLPVSSPPPVAGRSETCELPGEASSVPLARRFVRTTLSGWDREAYEEAGTLLVSELVGNAVLHARSRVQVELVDGAGGVLLTVTDGSTVLPVVRRHSREASTGRGLWLLDQYSASRGVERLAGGKQVWAVLRPEVADPAEGEGEDAALATWLDEVEAL